MINVTEAFKNAAKSPVRVWQAKLLSLDSERQSFTSGDFLASISIESAGELFSTSASIVKAKLLGVDYDLEGDEFSVEFSLLVADDTEETIGYGAFVVSKQTTNLEKGYTEIEMYSKMLQLQAMEYNSDSFTFPCTVSNLAEQIARTTGLIATDMGNLPNVDYNIQENLYEKITGANYRNILGEIAGATGTMAYINNSTSEIIFRPPQRDVQDLLTYDNMLKCDIKGKYGPINSVVLSRTPQEDNIVLVDEESVEKNGLCEVKLANNEIMDDNRQVFAQPLLNTIDDFEWTGFEITTEGHGWYEVGDRIKIAKKTIPDEYIPVEYLNSHGTEAIDTGVLNKDGINVELKASLDDTQGTGYDAAVFGARNGSNNATRNIVWFNNSNLSSHTLQWAYALKTKNDTSPEYDTVYKIEFKNKIFLVDNVIKQDFSEQTLTESNITLGLFGFKNSATGFDGRCFRGKVYSCKIWDGRELVRNFVPVVRKIDNKPGMYDTVNDIFYVNKRSGEFTYGEEIEDTVETYEGIITNISITMDGGMKEILKGVTPQGTTTDYATAGGITKTIYNTQIKVDKQQNEITSIVQRQDQTDQEMQDNYTEIHQNLNSIVNTIQTSGGGNLLKNSVGFDVLNNGVLSSWASDGSVISGTSPSSLSSGAISGNQITLGTGSSITQRVYVASDGNTKYSFSTRIFKSIVGNARITIFNTNQSFEVNLSDQTAFAWRQVSILAIEPTMGYFDVKIENIDAPILHITDTMFAQGDTSTPWQQASSEILNTQVALTSDGVKVKSSTYSGDYVQITPLEFAGYSSASGTSKKVFTVNRETTEVQKLSVVDEIDMVPIKIVPIKNGNRAGWSFVKVS
ncbi:MAG: hypothetical protein Q4E47_01175 [Candidatus Saccharibacteria bacterium]|nr:hypothetical protein [Candidatus Saccharibacteria bacterium]